jgi:hypothetical protein
LELLRALIRVELRDMQPFRRYQRVSEVSC